MNKINFFKYEDFKIDFFDACKKYNVDSFVNLKQEDIFQIVMFEKFNIDVVAADDEPFWIALVPDDNQCINFLMKYS